MAANLVMQLTEPAHHPGTPRTRSRSPCGRARGESHLSDVSMVGSNPIEAPDRMMVEDPPEDGAVAKSPLFWLPREIRDIIWARCLVTQKPIRWPSDGFAAGLTPALLATCTKIRAETLHLLYERNMLHFFHPSDANMFLWAHAGSGGYGNNSVLNGRLATRLLLDCLDADVRVLWTGYLGSTTTTRSLLHDYPHLRVLHITLQSRFWDLLAGDVIDKYRRWQGDRSLRDICQALDGHTNEGADVKVLLVHRVPTHDIAALKAAYPRDLLLERNADGGVGGVVRTRWTRLFRADVALELCPVEEFAGP